MRCETHMGGSERRRFLDKGRTATWFRVVYVVNGEKPPSGGGHQKHRRINTLVTSLVAASVGGFRGEVLHRRKLRAITSGIGSQGKGAISLVHHLVFFVRDIVQFPALGFRFVCLSNPRGRSLTLSLSLGRKAVVRSRDPTKRGNAGKSLKTARALLISHCGFLLVLAACRCSPASERGRRTKTITTCHAAAGRFVRIILA